MLELSSIVIIILVIIILLLVLFIHNLKINGKTIIQADLHNKYDALYASENDEKVEEFLETAELVQQDDALTNFMIGQVMFRHQNDTSDAVKYIEKSLNIIQNDDAHDPNYMTILDAMTDLREIDPAFNHLNVDIGYRNEYKKGLTDIKELVEEYKDTPNKEEKLLHALKLDVYNENKANGITGNQNVHDNNMTHVLDTQIRQVKADNLTNVSTTDYKDAINYVTNYIRSRRPEQKAALDAYKDILTHNYPITFLESKMTEQSFIDLIWKRIHDQRNLTNRSNLEVAFADSMLDCVEDGKIPVCITGRTRKLWQTFAMLDFNPELGIFKTKDMIKLEIYNLASNVLNEHLNKADDVTRQDYENNINSAKVKMLKDDILKDFEQKAKADYATLLPAESFRICVDTAKSVIDN